MTDNSSGHRFEDPREVLRRHGLKPSRKHSQNFLTAPWAIDAIADASVPRTTDPQDSVLELGPGTGTLTNALLERGARVVAIEKDTNLIALLQHEFKEAISSGRLRIEEGDAARAPLAAKHVVGNLPYSITGKILRNIVEHRAEISTATIMIQKEVSERLRAGPNTKNYGILTVMVQNNFVVDSVCDVRAGNFFPPPKVDSTVVQLNRRKVSIATHSPLFERVVRSAFGQRRKTLRKALGSAFKVDQAEIARCNELGLDLSRRAETLSIEEFGTLATALAKAEAR